jgi:hypothetical protein
MKNEMRVLSRRVLTVLNTNKEVAADDNEQQLPIFPINTKSELLDFEASLAENSSSMRLKLVSRFMLFINLLNFTSTVIIYPQKKLLMTIFGKTFETSARAKLRTIMTDTCANNFSVQGTSVKISIRNFEIINFIRGEQFLK